MKWARVGSHGMQSGDFKVGKFAVDEGALCTLYGLWKGDEKIGYFNSFEECQEAAEGIVANV